MSGSNGVIVVGASGYIGSRLVPALNSIGYEVEEIDCGVYDNVPAARKRDVREETPPGDGRPVIWLATIHREPDGFTTLEKDGQAKWLTAMEEIMLKRIEPWIRAGHEVIFPSSMQVVSPMGRSYYGVAKNLFEMSWVGTPGVQIVRFGTIWGGFSTPGPVRVETAVNSAILGRKLTDNYIAYTTHIDRAVNAFAHMLQRPAQGTVENCVDNEEPMTGPQINAIIDTHPRKRSLWQLAFLQEREAAKLRADCKGSRRHFTRMLADFYHLPWPEKTPEEWKIG